MKVWKKIDLFNGANADNVQVASDDYQLVFVDGRDGNEAKRIITTRAGNIQAETIGVQRPHQQPEIVNVKLTTRQDQGTLIPRGNIIMVCYTYVNSHEEESNPSPVAIIDEIQYQAKGYYSKDGERYYYPIAGGEYTYDQNKVGSIDTIFIAAKIDSPDIRRINVYIADAGYSESIEPPSAFRLITSQIVRAGAEQAIIAIASPRSIAQVSYENDISPRGDAITLIDGITFIGNANKGLGLLGEPEKVWAITLSNRNKFNYINRWFRLDLLDEAGVKPVGSQYFEGIEDWESEDFNKFRLMDSDLITPLEVFSYPIDAQLKTHRDVFAQNDGTRASVLINFTSEGYSGALDIYAREYGIGGNSLSIEMKAGTTTGYIQGRHNDEEGINDRIIILSAIGAHHIKLVLKEAEGSQSLSLSHSESDGKHTIEITPESNNGVAESTLDDIYNYLIAHSASVGSALYGVIASVDIIEADPNTSYVPQAQEIYFSEYRTTISRQLDKTTIYLGYDSGKEMFVSTISAIRGAINSLQTGNIRAEISGNIWARAYPIPETSLSGGAGIAPVSPSSTIDTRLLSFIRIPIFYAMQEKTIYLVKFKEDPGKISNKMRVIDIVAPSGGMSLSDFYEDKLLKNPILDENTVGLMREVRSDKIIDNSITDSSNVANTMLDGVNHDDVALVNTSNVQYDEYAKRAGIEIAYPWKAIKTNTIDFHYKAMRLGVNMPEEGYAWCMFPFPPLKINTSYFMIANIDKNNKPIYKNLIGFGYIIEYGEPEKLAIYGYDKSGRKTTVPIDYSPPPGYHDDIFVLFSWMVSRTTINNILVSIALMFGNDYVFVQNEIQIELDMQKEIALFYPGNTGGFPFGIPLDSNLPGIRINEFIENEWQALNAMKFMPLYPTEGIGAYDEFRENTNDGISYVNKNTVIQTINMKQDTRPGRIQWGAYGAMPDLNEYAINEYIMAMIPIKSFQPTDEHNTIIILTRDNTYLLSLLGDKANDCNVTRILSGIGLKNSNAYCITNNGAAWLSQRGLIVITADGTSNVSEGRIDMLSINDIVYDQKRNWIWARGAELTYVYQVDENLWWRYVGDKHPDDFLGEIAGKEVWISYSDKVIYNNGNTGGNTLIKTRALKAVKKIGRIMPNGAYMGLIVKIKARMFSNRIDGMASETSDVSVKINSPVAIPGVSADFVQIDVKDASNISNLLVEYEDGLKDG